MRGKIDIKIKNHIAFCTVENKLVASDLEIIADAISEYLDDSQTYDQVTLDLKNLEVIDSIGISWLIQMYKRFSEKGKSFNLIRVSEPIMELLKILRLDEIIDISVDKE